jgi:thiol-disulfide isomerase/thioredoxin
LFSYYGDQQDKIDSAMADDRGVFSFVFPATREPGIYYLSVAKQDGMDFIFNKENADIQIDRKFTPDSAVVTKSLENNLMFEYLSKKIFYERRLQVLKPAVQFYPEEDPFHDDLDKQYTKLDKEYQNYLQKIYKDHPGLIVTRFIKFDQLVDVQPGNISPEQTAYLKQHYFDGIDLTDTLLLYSPLLPGRIIDYLSLYVLPGIGKEQQESLFMDAIDSLMAFTLPGNKVKEVVINYLVEGFQAYGLEDLMEYLVDTYVLDQSCVSEQKEETLRKRVEGFKKLAVGNTAPDFEARDLNGSLVRLSWLPKDYKVLVFWASDCPHCEESMPGIKNIATEYADRVQVIAVSVDTSETAWKTAVEKNGMDWINIAELKGWDGQIASDYYIYATPTILILYKDLKILAKPTGVRELEEEMKELTGR